MDEKLKKKERELELATIDEEIAEKHSSIVQKKMLEKEMRAKYGINWRKILGTTLKPNQESLQSLYSLNPELKDMSKPSFSRLRSLR